MAFLELKDISKSYKKTVLRQLNLNFEKSQFVSIIGPSGCGKSTLLRLIAGLETPDAGEIRTHAQNLSMVFQEANLLPWLSVQENVELPLHLKGITTDKAFIESLFTNFKIEKDHHDYPHELSGGMKMRAALARSFALKPDLLLLDEPFSALDEPTRFQLQEFTRQLFFSSRINFILVTHSLYEAVFLSDFVIIMNLNSDIMLHSINLNSVRDSELRMKPEFFQEMQNLQRVYNEFQK
jgi:NitT/TauT family transport system ATP-binding protein